MTTPLSPTELERLQTIDRTIVAAAKPVKILSRLSWPVAVQQAFFAGGTNQMPQVGYPMPDLFDERQALTQAIAEIGGEEDPLQRFLTRTARSYVDAIDLIHAAGTPAMQEPTFSLYTAPGDALSGGLDNLTAARHFLTVAESYRRQNVSEELDFCLSAEVVKKELGDRLDEVFPKDTINVVIDPGMASKAAAGATRIRLRAGTCFTEYDVEQLLQHEAFIHSLTALNGRGQSRFRCFSLGAPRTTGPQEGLATFAELVTGAVDITRMERIALRVVAVQHALDGADFMEVYRFFLERGQSELESFSSAMRVFRGAPLTGGYAFTKDVVYLHGLMEVHTFFRWALQHECLHLCKHFFAGRMTIGDAVRLDPYFESGVLDAPRYLPPWLSRTNGLAGYLAFSVFANKIRIQALDDTHRFDAVGANE